jgi:hypothetical protein
MGPVTTGKRAAPRHSGPRADGSPETRRGGALGGRGPLLLLALGITAAVIAWGFLVYLAIDFGTSARDGDAAGWWLLALTTIGAIACLFVAMMLGTRLVAAFRDGPAPSGPPRPPGGRRAAR